MSITENNHFSGLNWRIFFYDTKYWRRIVKDIQKNKEKKDHSLEMFFEQ